jgi:exosortase E/protease (VPEID-CTERM system)
MSTSPEVKPAASAAASLHKTRLPGKILSGPRLSGQRRADDLSSGRLPSFLPTFLLGRLILLAVLLVADLLLFAAIPGTLYLPGPLASFVVASYAVFVGLGYSEFKAQTQKLPFRAGLFLLHLGCLLALWLTAMGSFHAIGLVAESIATRILLRGLLLIGIALLALACIPLETWLSILRKTRLLWLYSAMAGALAWCLRHPMQSFWDASRSAPVRLLQIATFHSVKAVLLPVLPAIYVDPETFVLGTHRFSVLIAEQCSGLEGLGLVLAFTTVWLWYFRKESRFPQALLLVPCALACVWILNVLRIAALVLIGDAGYAEVAMVGFHSQAGWIAFTAVAFAFSMATRKLAWVSKIPARGIAEEPIAGTGESPATGAYLVPFLAILAASFLSKAASAYFEWLYPLRFLAALIAIWHYRRELRKIDWRFGWLAPVAGAAVFALWIIPSVLTSSAEASRLGNALSALSPAARWSWIAFRVAAAAITVPIAEELAFRGYLARRLVNREFDSVPFSAVTVFAIAVSSVVFGLMHGRHWIPGILAGLAYALVMKWRGRLGDAIAAHATSNLLLAIWVLARGDWAQW